ncbi:MAG: hypothetical protein ACQETD_02810 [Pseudomonadota bacterium]
MSNGLKIIVMLLLLTLSSMPAAEEGGASVQSQSEPQDQAQEGEESQGLSGLLIAGGVFFVAIAYLVSSATAMNRLGGTPTPKRGDRPGPSGGTAPRQAPKPRSPSGSRLPQGRDRFRL